MRTAAAALDLIATAVAFAALAWLHLRPTGLSPVRNAVSQYGISTYRQGYRVLTVALGVAGLGAAVVVARAGAHAVVVALLAVFGLCRLVISWVPMDAPGAPRTARGTAHLLLALGAFGPATAAAERLRAAGAVFSVAAAVLLVGLIGMLLVRAWFGLAERLVYVGIGILLVGIAVQLG